MRQPHYTQIGPQMLERNSEQVDILVADKGYDSAEFREFLPVSMYKAGDQARRIFVA